MFFIFGGKVRAIAADGVNCAASCRRIQPVFAISKKTKWAEQCVKISLAICVILHFTAIVSCHHERFWFEESNQSPDFRYNWGTRCPRRWTSLTACCSVLPRCGACFLGSWNPPLSFFEGVRWRGSRDVGRHFQLPRPQDWLLHRRGRGRGGETGDNKTLQMRIFLIIAPIITRW